MGPSERDCSKVFLSYFGGATVWDASTSCGLQFDAWLLHLNFKSVNGLEKQKMA